MTLKSELQAIEPATINQSAFAYDQKVESLAASSNQFFKEEIEAIIARYPALNELVSVTTELFLRGGNYSYESVICAGAAASFVVGTLVEIAETQALPPLAEN